MIRFTKLRYPWISLTHTQAHRRAQAHAHWRTYEEIDTSCSPCFGCITRKAMHTTTFRSVWVAQYFNTVDHAPLKLLNWARYSSGSLKTCCTILKLCLSSHVLSLWWTDAREGFTPCAATDLPLLQHLLRKRPDGPWRAGSGVFFRDTLTEDMKRV